MYVSALKVAVFSCQVDDLIVPIWPYQFFNALQSDRRSELNTVRVPVNSSHSELVTGDEFTVAFFHFCDEFTVWRLHCDELYDWCLLYSTLAVGVLCPSVAVICWWRTRANQFWDDFFVIILCRILMLKCIKFGFDYFGRSSIIDFTWLYVNISLIFWPFKPESLARLVWWIVN